LKKYELLSIIKPNLDMEEIDKVVASLEENIKKIGGNVFNTDKMGRRKLAFEMQKFRDGFYVILNIELPENKVVELRRYIKLNENYLKEMVFVASKEKVAVK